MMPKLPRQYQRPHTSGPLKQISYSVNNVGCWICTSYYKDHQGYPILGYAGQVMHMSRWVYCKANNFKLEQLNKKVIMHICDNPSCINPSHLSCGEQRDNIKDMVRKKRDRAGMYKVSYEQAVLLNKSKNAHSKLLEEMFDLSRSQVHKIRTLDAKEIKERYTL